MAVDTKELMKMVGRIRIITKKLVDEHLSGEYHSAFKGQGIEFEEVREYTPGDDVRSIDWNVTARMGYPYVKRFSEERELTIMFLVDISGSQIFGSDEYSKAELAAMVTSVFALSAIKNQDKIGLILFSDRIEKSLPPRKGRTAVMRLVREVLAAEETNRGTDIAAALRFMNNVQKRKAVVFLISDFMDAGYEKELKVLAKRHDVICCPISDPREFDLVNAGLVEVEDPETGNLFMLDTSSKSFAKEFKQNGEIERRKLEDMFVKYKIDHIPLSTDRPFQDDIRKLFRQRQLRKKHG
ncbi:MAG: DUF58 domain-containing protein [Kiritimatiellae bacterium]|jgi:uncharacterized protein (DUF58 family)|nr:DUF58 domain-containing protein [Kiritimatiellia bacterium]